LSEDLPIYSDMLRRGPHPFSDLEGLASVNLAPCWERFDRLFDLGDGARGVALARRALNAPTKELLLTAHSVLFEGRAGAGSLRQTLTGAAFRGQDCPEPEFIDRSLDNFVRWLTAPSFIEIHPVERAALALTRLIDIWPFEFGNRTAAVLFANCFLFEAHLPPFFLLGEQLSEFDQVLRGAIAMQTEPLVKAMYLSMRRELALVGK
jgi:hypothetical protein